MLQLFHNTPCWMPIIKTIGRIPFQGNPQKNYDVMFPYNDPKAFLVKVHSIPLVFAHFLIFWHFELNNLLKFLCNFAPLLCSKHHVCARILWSLLSCMLNMFTFDESHDLIMIPISLPLMTLANCYCFG